MDRVNSLGIFLYLPLMIFVWENSSCRNSISNSATNPPVNVSTRSSSNQTTSVLGHWGGQHIAMEVTEAGAEIDYDCAHGRITEKITPNREGKFMVKGVHARERGGPSRIDEQNEEAASYGGSITGDTMTLTVTLTKNDETVGTFTLKHGSTGRIRKCL